MTINKDKVELPTWLISILIPLLFAGIFYIISGISELKANMTTVIKNVDMVQKSLNDHINSTR